MARYKKILEPFNIKEFISENEELVEKYLKKNTRELDIPDFIDIPSDWYYKGNPNILAGGVDRSESFSQLQKLEYIKCSQDCVYFTEKYIKIISIDDGVIPFKLYRYQKKLLKIYQQNRFSCVLQCRQSGKTQTTAAFILWFSLFHDTKTVAILANKKAQAVEILERIQLSFENLPKFLQGGVLYYNKGSTKLSNLSTIFCAASSSGSIRGKSVSLLYIDEAAFIPRDMEFYESTYPVISSGKESRVIMTSTPNGQRGLFYKIYTEAESKKNNYTTLKVIWSEVPGRNEAWRRQAIDNTSPEQFKQEFECVFRGSQNSLLSGDSLERLVSQPIIEQHGKLNVYELPVKYDSDKKESKSNKDHIYAITVDTSRGVGGDYSTFSVFDTTNIPYKQVATYRDNRISPMLYPSIIMNTAMFYNNAFVLVEINDIGEQVASILYHDMEYENILCCFNDKSRQVVGYGSGMKYGVRTTTQVKSIGVSNLKTLVESEKLIVCDSETINELGTFIPKGRSYEADQGCHDDMVMTLVLFSWLTTQQFFIDIIDKDTRKIISDSYSEQMFEELVPFGIIDSDFGTFGIEEVRDSFQYGVF